MSSERTVPTSVTACAYRNPGVTGGEDGLAVCSLLQLISRVENEGFCHVGTEVCEACCQGERPGPEKINPVIASLLYQVAVDVMDAGGLPGCTVAEAVDLKARAFRHLAWRRGSKPVQSTRTCLASPERYRHNGRTYSCDVVICCSDSSPQTELALRSVLSQADAVTQVHLVDNGGGGRELAQRYAQSGNVTVHRNLTPQTTLATVHDLIDRMRTQFIAIQDTRTVSRPFRVSYSVGLLEEHGGDILGASLRTATGDVRPRAPSDSYARYLPSETLVIRRASFVDMGGVAARPGEDDDAELVYRAGQEGRSILVAPEVTVQAQADYGDAPLGCPPDYEPRNGSLRHQAREFPHERVACDVVLPFWGQLDHVRQALESLLAQENADLVIHLVDDGSPDDTHSFLRYWATHPQIRTYRNLRNIGQFTTFNNLAPHFETGLVAVQDGDDISLPHRIRLAGNTMRLAGADIFGSAVVIIDDGEPRGCEGGNRLPPDINVGPWKNVGTSAWPTPEVYWFLFNPSMVLRTDVFRLLGGFSDFGTPVRNRCGHDIEFCLRAYHRGMRFAISREPTVFYRQHPAQTTRSPVTGYGTDAESWTSQEARRRQGIYRRTRFDPIAFGALGKYQHLTQPLRIDEQRA